MPQYDFILDNNACQCLTCIHCTENKIILMTPFFVCLTVMSASIWYYSKDLVHRGPDTVNLHTGVNLQQWAPQFASERFNLTVASINSRSFRVSLRVFWCPRWCVASKKLQKETWKHFCAMIPFGREACKGDWADPFCILPLCIHHLQEQYISTQQEAKSAVPRQGVSALNGVSIFNSM